MAEGLRRWTPPGAERGTLPPAPEPIRRWTPPEGNTSVTTEQPNNPSLLERATRLGGVFSHGLASAAGSLADVANRVEKNMEGGFSLENDQKSPDNPNAPNYDLKSYQTPEVTALLGNKVNQLFGTDLNPKDAFEKFVHLAGEFSLPIGGIGSKGASLPMKLLKHEAIAGGGAAGMTLAEEAGVENELGKMAFGVAGSSLATSSPLKLALHMAGVGKKNLNLKALEAAERLGVDLPLVSVTKGKVPNIGQKVIEHFPHVGEKIEEKFTQASTQYQEALEGLLESVGPKTSDLAKEGPDIYAKVHSITPVSDTIDPTPWLSKIAEIKDKLKTVVYSPKTEQLLGKLNEFESRLLPKTAEMPDYLQSANETVKKSFEQQTGKTPIKEIPVVEVLQQKRELNSLMRDKNLFDGSDKRTLNFFKGLAKTTDDMLEGYGLTQNPEFLKELKKANSAYAAVAKRDVLETLLEDKLSGLVTETPSYNALIKTLQKKSNQKLLKNNLGEEKYSKLGDFIDVGKAMESVKRKNINPSGTAWTNALLGIATGLYTHPEHTMYVLGAMKGGQSLLTSKRFLNLTKRYAKQPTESIAQKLEFLIKDTTGMTAVEINKKLTQTGSS